MYAQLINEQSPNIHETTPYSMMVSGRDPPSRRVVLSCTSIYLPSKHCSYRMSSYPKLLVRPRSPLHTHALYTHTELAVFQ